MTTNETWHCFSDASACSLALAQALTQELQRLLSLQARVVLAVSGGHSPRTMMAALSHAGVDWSRVLIQWVDERLLSCHHPNSNSELIESVLRQHQAAVSQWHNELPEVTDSPRELTDVEQQAVLQAASERYQKPDIVVLGMGEDGHTASLFPHAKQLPQALNLHNTTPLMLLQDVVAPYTRISMTLPAILSAQVIFIAAYGQQKRAVLQQAAKQLDANLPISSVFHHAQEIPVYVYC